LKARQKTLTTADNTDMKAINANIDEITKIQNQLMKKSVAMKQQFRSLLNDEQKVWYDSRSMKKGQQRGMEHKRGFQNQQGSKMQSYRNTTGEV
jgi:Spy/CpxP family protein refolding chaperone